MKCPRCGRDTYSKKWDACTACKYPALSKDVPHVKALVVPTEAQMVQAATAPEHECPICGQLHARAVFRNGRDRVTGKTVTSDTPVTAGPAPLQLPPDVTASVTDRGSVTARADKRYGTSAERQRAYRARRSQEQGQGTG